MAIANEDGLDVTGNKSEKEGESSDNATEISVVAPEPVLPSTKKSGKKSRKKDKDWLVIDYYTMYLNDYSASAIFVCRLIYN